VFGDRVRVRVEYRTRPPTAHHLSETIDVERLGDLSKNGPELGLERDAVLPVEGHPDSRPALVQPGYERGRDEISHVRTLARWSDDNASDAAPNRYRWSPGRNLCRVASMGPRIRLTLQTLQVLRALLDDPAGEHYGLEISKESGLPTGSIYPILARMEASGLVTSAWEDIDEAAAKRRRRRYYRLTSEGLEFARSEVANAARSLAPARRHPSGHLRPGEAST
jgi:PadR family transcriptional regulator PadR